jgi:hypothetical protein
MLQIIRGDIPTLPPKKAKPPGPPERKKRTITLTNRRPIQIFEDEWPVIAEGACGKEWMPGQDWSIRVRVRRSRFRYIIYAKYEYNNENSEDWQTVRVGRYLDTSQSDDALCKHLLEVGEELRARMACENLRKHVIYAVDGCFANLPAQSIDTDGPSPGD